MSIKPAFYKRAFCYYELKKFAKARVDVKRALKVPQTDNGYNKIMSDSYWLYSLIVSHKANSMKALQLIKNATNYNRHSSSLYSTIGYKEVDLGLYDSAMVDLNHAIELNKFNAWAYSNRAWAYLKKNLLDSARKDVNYSIELDKTNLFAYKHSALIYIALHDYESACLELDKAQKLEYSDNMVIRAPKEIRQLINKYCKASDSKRNKAKEEK
ncbi:MAG: hypothetical protein WCH34_16305 [Bacteroidota bacterium]